MTTKVDVLLDQIDNLLKELNDHFQDGYFFIDYCDGDNENDDQRSRLPDYA